MTCQKYICTRCLVESHNGHEHKSAKSLHEEAKAINASKIDSCDEKIVELQRTINSLDQAMTNADTSANAEITKINTLVDSAIKELENRRKELINDAESKRNDYKSALKGKKEELSQKLTETKECMFHGKRADLNSNVNLQEEASCIFGNSKLRVNCYANDIEATLNHYEKVGNEMDAVVYGAHELNNDARKIRQETYEFESEDIIEYIKRFGRIETNESDIPYESTGVSSDTITKIDKEFEGKINEKFPEIKPSQNANLPFGIVGPLPSQPSQPSQGSQGSQPFPIQGSQPSKVSQTFQPPPPPQTFSQSNSQPLPPQPPQFPQELPPQTSQNEYPQKDLQDEYPQRDLQDEYPQEPQPVFPPTSGPRSAASSEPAPAGGAAPVTSPVTSSQSVGITSIDPPKVFCNPLGDGGVEISWAVDPKIMGLDYAVGIFVGNEQVQDVPRGSTRYTFKTPVPKGTGISVATAYGNVASGYCQIIV